MTQRLCWDVRQDVRAAHVGLSVGHFIHSFHEHTPRICSGPSTVLGVGESAMRMTLYFPLPTSRCGGCGGGGGRRRPGWCRCAGETHGGGSVEHRAGASWGRGTSELRSGGVMAAVQNTLSVYALLLHDKSS